MKATWRIVALSIALLALSTPLALAQDDHQLFIPEDIEWGAGPASLPDRSEAVVMYGNPGEEELFALRLKFPEGYYIPPHFHPKPEIVTVISGTFKIGMGETADENAVEAFGPGSFIAIPPGSAHFVYTDEKVVVQLNSSGPWGLEYVDPEDDQRVESD